MNESISYRFKIPFVEAYDGSTDLIDHLEGYRAFMRLQGIFDVLLLCMAFLVTFKKMLGCDSQFCYLDLSTLSIS